MKRTKAQNKKLHYLLNDTGLMKYKQELVSSFTHARTQHSSHMSRDECERLIDHLANQPHDDGNEVQKDIMRKKILHMAHELGWEKQDGTIDWHKLNHWLLQYGHKHKRLNDYSYNELVRLVSQFENGPYRYYLTKTAKHE